MARSIFEKGSAVDISMVLENRDRRVAVQQRILEETPDKVLIVMKLNVPGPIKNNMALEQLFTIGVHRFNSLLVQNNLVVTPIMKWHELTGNELFCQSSGDSAVVKRVAVEFEDTDLLGRIFDVDILIGNPAKAISRTDLGFPLRHCFVCRRPAKECARARRHPVAKLQGYFDHLYQQVSNNEGDSHDK